MESGLIITNIKSSVDEKLIRNEFEEFGKILHLNLLPDKFNEKKKICYLNYTSPESALKAIQKHDNGTSLGDPLRVAFKKIISKFENTMNGGSGTGSVSRNPSFGRGRGMAAETNRNPRSMSRPVSLRNIDIPLKTKLIVEIIELTTVNNILARPLLLTDSSKSHLVEILGAINENTNALADVRFPEIDGFYLAKWNEDNNFYRAKLLEKLGNNSYKVCFVDEGTSGDIVNELKEIPKEISEFPCQFLPCTLDCEDDPSLLNIAKVNGINATVSIYVTSPDLVDGKYQINLFIDDEDILDINRKSSGEDRRKKSKLPHISQLKHHSKMSEFTNFHFIDFPKQRSDVFKVVLQEPINKNPRLEPLEFSPIIGDILIYRQSDSYWHRSVLESIKFSSGRDSNQIFYGIRLIDEDRHIETSIDSLFRVEGSDRTIESSPPGVIDCILHRDNDGLNASDKIEKIVILDFDEKKSLYTVKVIKTVPKCVGKPSSAIGTKTGLSVSVGGTLNVCMSHVESPDEIYVRLADADSVETLDRIYTKINDKNFSSNGFSSIRQIKPGQLVVAPFMEENYRAIIKEIDTNKSMVRVFFIDYGNSETVGLKELSELSEDSEIGRIPPCAKRCSLPVTVKPENMQKIVEMLMDYCNHGNSEVTMKLLASTSVGGEEQMIVNFFMENKTGFVDILKSKNLGEEKEIQTGSQSRPKIDLLEKVLELEKRIRNLERMVENRR